MTLLTYFLFGLCFLVLSAFFSSMETSIFSLSVSDRQNLSKKNKSLKNILSNQNNVLVAILFANTFVNIGFSLAVDNITLNTLGHGPLSVFLSIVLATILVLIFGEVLPKNFAIFHRNFLAPRGSPYLQYLTWMLMPIIILSRRFVSFFVNRMKHLIPNAYPQIMKDELVVLAGLQRRKSSLNTTEKQLLQNITRISQLKAGDIVTPRVETDMVDLTRPEKEIRRQLKRFKHRFVPAYRKSIDDVKGIIDAKMYMLSSGSLKNYLRKPCFVPETKKILPLLQEMKTLDIPIVIIVDEFGGFVGLVTMEDIVEEITGDISDEFDKEESVMQRLKPNHFIIPGDTRIEDIENRLRIKLEGDPADTLNAFLLEKCGDIPEKGYQYKIGENILIIVSDASQRKVIEAEIKIL